MRNSIVLTSLVVLSTAIGAAAQDKKSPAPPNAAGHWEGVIAMPDGDVKFAIDLAKKDKAKWIGSLSILGTTATDVPLTEIAIEGAKTRFHAQLMESPTFEGAISDDGSAIEGEASNVKGAVQFHLKRAGDAKVVEPVPSSPMSKEIAGVWNGSLAAPSMTMRIVLNISAGPDGLAAATLHNLDRPGAVPIPLTTVIFKDGELRLESRAVSGKFAGKLGADGIIAGEWTQGGMNMPLTFKR